MLLHHSNRTLITFYSRILFGFLGKAMQAACKIDKRLLHEINELPEGSLMSFRIENELIGITMQKHGNSFEKIVKKDSKAIPTVTSNVVFRFNSFNDFLYVWHNDRSMQQAISEGRIHTEGPAALACRYIRIVNATIIYLFCKRVAQRKVRRYEPPPRLYLRRCSILARMLFQRRRTDNVLQ